MAKTDLTNVLVSVFKISSTGCYAHGSPRRDTVFVFQPPYGLPGE